jgi:ferritin-like metal-binding protein YciE
LEQVFAMIDEKPQGKTCAAIVGITNEGAEIMQEYKGSPALDAGLLSAARAVEHYEISRYGTLRTKTAIFCPRCRKSHKLSVIWAWLANETPLARDESTSRKSAA